MTAPAERNTAVNVGGTTHAVELARAVDAKHLHHVSSIAVAGEYRGVFSEEMFDEGQRLPSPYHRTKFESERIVREQPYVPWRVYRPGIVVGDSRTGEMDKIDGPYYFFNATPAARVGPARRARPRLHERRPGRLGRRCARAHRSPARHRRARVPPDGPAPAARR
jgi:thioester reductase-like protein